MLRTTRLDIREQTGAVIENIRDILRAVGAELHDLAQLTSYLVNLNDFAGYNEAGWPRIGTSDDL
jgi:2-aminomuconate deaminase